MAALYFAYGSNLLRERLLSRCPRAEFIGRGLLRRHRLSFEKVSTDGSGKCAVERDDGCEVQGVAWRVHSSELDGLDLSEGVSRGYERSSVAVELEDATIQDAIAYRATQRDPSLIPYDWYLALVVAGARQQRLGKPYISILRATPWMPDPIESRRSRREAIALLRRAGFGEVANVLRG